MRAIRYVLSAIALISVSACPFDLKYTVGGNVAGLIGTGMVLENNAGDSLAFTGNGAFSFTTTIAKGDPYSVTVVTQPTGPTQTCTVYNGSGTIPNANVVNVVVTCTQPGRFAYVANQTDNDISAYVIDSTSGLLDPIVGSPFSANGTSPIAMAVAPYGSHGSYLYVVNSVSNEIFSYAIAYDTGVLTSAGDAVATGIAPSALVIDPTGRFLYVTNSTDNTVSAYSLSAGIATPLSGSPYAVGAGPFAVKTDPGGNYLYVANYTDATVSAFLIDPTGGLLTPMTGSPFGAGEGAISIAIDPTGTYAFVANEKAETISSYSITADAGTLVPLSGSPLSTGTSPESLVVNYGGSILYAANVTAANQIAPYTITPSTGALTLGSPVGSGTFPVSLVIDAAGGFLYAADFTSNDVSVYTVNAATGALTQVTDSPFLAGRGPRAIAVD